MGVLLWNGKVRGLNLRAAHRSVAGQCLLGLRWASTRCRGCLGGLHTTFRLHSLGLPITTDTQSSALVPLVCRR